MFSYTHEDVVAARELKSFDAHNWTMKEEGNSAFRVGLLSDALASYEKALSVWRYLENTNPSFKTEGIKDKFIIENCYECKDNDEQKTLDRFLVMCYNNIALVSCKMDDYPLAIKACDYAVEVDATNDKEYFIRAKARTLPKSVGS